MGDCVYCGKPAGIFRSKHSECAAQRDRAAALELREQQERIAEAQAAVRALAEQVNLTIRPGGDLLVLHQELNDAVARKVISQLDATNMLLSGWEACLDSFLDDGLLDDHEEDRLVAVQKHFSLNARDLDRRGAYTRATKAAVLKNVLSGKLPPNVDVDPACPVNFQKGERPVWSFPNTQYSEDVVRKQFVGGSQGMSFRVMSGVYYRIGGFKGESVATIQRRQLGTGLMLATNRNLYFVGPGKTTRIPYTKIVAFTPYSDGIGVMRDAATAKPQYFVTGDGWFTCNLITNLAKL